MVVEFALEGRWKKQKGCEGVGSSIGETEARPETKSMGNQFFIQVMKCPSSSKRRSRKCGVNGTGESSPWMEIEKTMKVKCLFY